MIRFHIIRTPEIMTNMRAKGPQIIKTLTEKMHRLMLDLAVRVQTVTIPEEFPGGAPSIAQTVKEIPPVVVGTTIRGRVEAGGPETTKRTLGGENVGHAVDYA